MIQEIRSSSIDLNPLIQNFDIQTHLNNKLSNLSGGTKQKVNLAIALMYDNPIYILDEPTAGLDPISLLKLKYMLLELKNNGHLIIITTHIMSLVEELADNIVFLLEGQIRFSGTVQQLNNIYKEKSLERSIAALLRNETNN